MNNTKKIYQHAGKCDDKQNLKDIIDATILSTPEGVTDNSPNVHMPSTPVKKPSAKEIIVFVHKHIGCSTKNRQTSFCGCRIQTQIHESVQ